MAKTKRFIRDRQEAEALAAKKGKANGVGLAFVFAVIWMISTGNVVVGVVLGGVIGAAVQLFVARRIRKKFDRLGYLSY